MDIVSKFHEVFCDQNTRTHDFRLFQYTPELLIGQDSDQNVVIVCKSSQPARSIVRQKTRQLSIECNVRVTYFIDGAQETGVVHIVRCFASTEKERDIFLQLCPMFIDASVCDDQERALLELISILTAFFANNNEPSNQELQGLYAELYTIWSYRDQYDFGSHWHSNDRLKFDFSITDKVKVEIKSTLKNERKHHFRHEQLLGELFSIFVISYMLRLDDEGLSLYDLIKITKPLIAADPRRLLILARYEKNTSEQRLQQFRFSEAITNNKRRVYRATDIPRFNELTPNGVSNAEYDCLLENVPALEEEAFIALLHSATATEMK